MGLVDKARNKAEEVAGAVKEKVGRATDDEQLRDEGRQEQTEAKIDQVGEHLKDAGRDVRDVFRG